MQSRNERSSLNVNVRSQEGEQDLLLFVDQINVTAKGTDAVSTPIVFCGKMSIVRRNESVVQN